MRVLCQCMPVIRARARRSAHHDVGGAMREPVVALVVALVLVLVLPVLWPAMEVVVSILLKFRWWWFGGVEVEVLC
eukprot:2955830-Rhodomonas_salina.1